MKALKTKAQIDKEADALRRNIGLTFGKNPHVTEAVVSTVKAKITSAMLAMIDATLSSYQPEELSLFLKAWGEAEIRRL